MEETGIQAQPIQASPVTPAERIISLDVLRGFAILGILIMNVQSFSMIMASYINPSAFGDLTGLNRVVWTLSHVLADEKFMSIFSMLFGAGILMIAGRAEDKGLKAGSVHYRRSLWLILFGLMHAWGFSSCPWLHCSISVLVTPCNTGPRKPLRT